MTPDALFAYGSLRVPEVMLAVTGQRLPSQAALLADHAVLCIPGVVYPGLVQRAGSLARGVLYRGLDEQTLHVLDVFEDELYERLVLPVSPATGDAELVHVYRVCDAHRANLSDTPWDAAAFERDHAHDFAKRCQGFWQRVAASRDSAD